MRTGPKSLDAMSSINPDIMNNLGSLNSENGEDRDDDTDTVIKRVNDYHESEGKELLDSQYINTS